jgi:hypothetical protein
MSFNTNELIKIREATSKSEKSINIISDYLKQFKAKVGRINELDVDDRKKELIKLMNEESSKRKNALASGVSSYADPNWAAPSACETWVHCILGENDSEIKETENLINQMLNINRKPESKKSNIFGYLVIIVLCPLSFYFFSWWSAIIVFFIGTTIIGWKNRYD